MTQRSDATHKVAVLGATGMVGRQLVRRLLHHPDFTLGMIVGSDATTGARYRDVWEVKERSLREHYGSFWLESPVPDDLGDLRVSSFDDLLDSDCGIVFSSIPHRAGELEERLLRDGRLVFSNSPYRRFDPDVALVVPEVNGTAVTRSRLVKNPNCVTSGLILLLAPLHARYGLREVVVTTYQSLSGRGDAKYARDLVLGNIYPLHASSEDTERLIKQEVKTIIPDRFATSVTCNRTCVQEGHFVEVRIRTCMAVAAVGEVVEVLSRFNPLRDFDLHSSPPAPIVMLQERGRPRPLQDAHHHDGMAIAVGNLTTEDEVFDLRLTYVVNNLVRGAAGGALLNAELWNAMTQPAAVGEIAAPAPAVPSGSLT